MTKGKDAVPWRAHLGGARSELEKDAIELAVMRFLEKQRGYPITADMLLNAVTPLLFWKD